jgi:uncharacterized membrane protein YhaH (DUF805 family)
MSSTTVIDLVIGVAVLALLLSRQLTTRPLRESYRVSLILAILGVIQFINFLDGHPHGNDGGIAAAVIGSLVLAAVFGAARVPTIRVWRDSGRLLRKGSWLTAVLWVLAVAAHLGYDYLVAGHISGKNGGNVGDATILLYLVVTLTVQRFLLLRRVAREEAAADIPVAS